ncbi:V-type proton ATPase subunit H [Tetranychus urticae]|uniref:V-type proton ATPase subunit H n=1 Tax=Tetranychus cinnabarinus TaxID=93129 RepID=A0AA49QAR3_TETCI|nr:V-type proton ATPase subunit H [Tetranychus urticae]WLD09906.1 V-type proton ATPase subunit H [Tetranychus cinnabarinus]
MSSDISSLKLDSVLQNLPDDIEKGGVISATSVIQQKAAEVRNVRVNWHFYRSGDFISQQEFDWIVKYESLETAEARDEFFKKDAMLCAEVFLSLLEKLSKNQATQYILILIDDMLNEDKSRVEIFKEYCRKKGGAKKKRTIWSHMEHQLQKSDGLIQNMASRIITKIACWSKELMGETDLQFYICWLLEQLKLPNNEYLGSIARCLQMMLRIEEYRKLFISTEGIPTIISVLSNRVNFQIQYQLTFCLWLLSFHPSTSENMSKNNAIPALADILNESVKEKVTRIILATFRNLIEKPEDPEVSRDNAITMVQGKVLKQLDILKQASNKYEDPDLLEDIEFLYEKLQSYVSDLSSFDEYCNEVKSGRLEWSPVHSNEKFWRENALRLNEKNYELLKILIKILETSKDSLVLSVAIHDIGEYIRYYPRGKTVIENLNGKYLIMQLMDDADPNVKYEALLCVQKLVVHNWEYLGKQLEKEKDGQVAGKKPISVK